MAKKDKTADQVAQGDKVAHTPAPLPPAAIPSETPASVPDPTPTTAEAPPAPIVDTTTNAEPAPVNAEPNQLSPTQRIAELERELADAHRVNKVAIEEIKKYEAREEERKKVAEMLTEELKALRESINDDETIDSETTIEGKATGERLFTEAEVYRAMRYAVSGERGKRKMDDWSKQVGGAAMTYEQRFAEITHADFENGLVYEGDGKPWSPR